MLITPTMSNTCIDASKQSIINFTVIGADKYDGFEYEIYNQENEIAYSNIVNNSTNRIVIDANVLQNGLEYKIKLRTFIIELVNDKQVKQYSEWSNMYIIKTYKLATVTINNIQTVERQSHTFTGTYSSESNIPMKCYRYYLYDEGSTLIKSYQQQYTLSTTELEQFISGFDNDKTYKIKLECTDQNNMISVSPLYSFDCKFVSPKIKQLVNIEPDKCNATVFVSSDVRQLRFISGNDDWNYLNDDWIDLTRDGWIYMDRAFELLEDMDIQLWFKQLIQDTVFLFLQNQTSGDYLKVWYDSSRKYILCEKTYGKVKMLYRSINQIEFDDINTYTILIKQFNGQIGIYVEKVV